MRKYGYIDPTNGTYSFATSLEDLKIKLAELAAQTYINHYCSGMAYTIVDVNDDGSEKWYAPTGAEIMQPEELQEAILDNNIDLL